jgi:cell fate (sporulation/competence/biofilm development) regulator YmcA (YheA/YmcA/DUF963 family)
MTITIEKKHFYKLNAKKIIKEEIDKIVDEILDNTPLVDEEEMNELEDMFGGFAKYKKSELGSLRL